MLFFQTPRFPLFFPKYHFLYIFPFKIKTKKKANFMKNPKQNSSNKNQLSINQNCDRNNKSFISILPSTVLRLTSNFLLLISAFCLLPFAAYAQGVPEPMQKDIYQFLSRLSQKGIIELKDEIRPLSRQYIYNNLLMTNDLLTNDPDLPLTELEKQELKFYLQDYNIESSTEYKVLSTEHDQSSHRVTSAARNRDVNNVTSIPASLGEKSKDSTLTSNFSPLTSNPSSNPSIFTLNWSRNYFRLFTYSNDIFRINIDPIFGIKIGSRDGSSYKHYYGGARFYGYLGSDLAFSFDFRDNTESGDKLDRTKTFTPETGIIRSYVKSNSFQYSEIRTTISYNWKWGSITAAKDFLNWGYGKSGLIVNSSKAPSFPFIRLDLQPADWVSFNYTHAWLGSNVVDSSEVYASLRNGANRISFREKYLASHTITLYPIQGLSVSLGESVVYSDKLEMAYLFPLMFFRAADHYLSKNNNNAGANSQFFFGISSRNQIPNTHLYGSILIDEIALADMFNPERERNQTAFTLGASVVDLPIENLNLTLEYTKIYPFVYRHYIPTQTYESDNYTLGHWMGHNSDLLYGSLEYRILRGLKTELWARYIRKGGDGVVDDQYTRPSKPFLFGLRNNYTDFGFEVSYQFLNDLYFKLIYQNNTTSTEQNDGTFIDKKMNEFYFSLNYGF